VWLTRSGGPGVGIASSVALCLTGFAADQEVTLSVEGGGRTVDTPAKVRRSTRDRAPVGSLFVAPATLDLNRRPVEGLDQGLLESIHWTFVPPRAVRDALAVSRRIRITARQDGLTATRTMKVDVPDGDPFRWLEQDDDGRPLLVVIGFPAGARVPVGLYERIGATSSLDGPARLVRTLGQVDVGRSKVELFRLPAPVVRMGAATPDKYCVTVPLDEQFQVPCLPHPPD
jgi:hypothetical protein